MFGLADQLLQGPYKNSSFRGHVVGVGAVVNRPRPLFGDLHQQRAAEHHPPTPGHLRPGLRTDPAGAAQLRSDSPSRIRRIRRR